MRDGPTSKRPWFQLHLSTCVVLIAFIGAATGLWIRGSAWQAYADLCEVNPSRTIGTFSKDGKWCAVLRNDSTIGIFDSESGNLISVLEGPFGDNMDGKEADTSVAYARFQDDAIQIRFSDDNSRVYILFLDGGFEEWYVETWSFSSLNLKGWPIDASEPIQAVKDIKLVMADNEASVYRRIRTEEWWGLAFVPEFWLTVALALILCWTVYRNWKCSYQCAAQEPAP